MADPFGDDPDDPLALPFPPHTFVLDEADLPDEEALRDEAADLSQESPSLVRRILRQQLAELGLELRLRQGDGDCLELEGFRVQLVCAPFWAEELSLPPGPWRLRGRSPHLLLAAWVDEECGAVRLPGVLTAAELQERWPGFAEADPPPTLPLSAFQGGLDRLWLLLRLLSPDALLPAAAPVVAPAAVPPLAHTLATPSLATPTVAVRLGDWLEGVLAEALVARGAELLPASAGAFRSAAAPGAAGVPGSAAALASVAIPLALVRGRIESGPARGAGSERFRLLLQLHGAAQGAQWLEVRLEPELLGDLLPQRLTLRVGERAIDTGGDGGSGPLSLTVMGEEAIAIGLWHADGSNLTLPPLRFGATLGEPEPGSTG
ncbi:MAG: hypothetical protein ACK550_05690 [Synechococcaceae cyanobacterium]